MADATADSRLTIDAMIDAFARGDNAHAEVLLCDALDRGVPWDQVTMAAAHAVTRYRQTGLQTSLTPTA
jgi:hypothetical protein